MVMCFAVLRAFFFGTRVLSKEVEEEKDFGQAGRVFDGKGQHKGRDAFEVEPIPLHTMHAVNLYRRFLSGCISQVIIGQQEEIHFWDTLLT